MAFVVNLTGVLGVGKTAMLGAWACGDPARPGILRSHGAGRGVPVLDLDTAVEEGLRLALTSPSSWRWGSTASTGRTPRSCSST